MIIPISEVRIVAYTVAVFICPDNLKKNKVIQNVYLPFLKYQFSWSSFQHMQAHCANLITFTKSGLQFNQKIVKNFHIYIY